MIRALIFLLLIISPIASFSQVELTEEEKAEYERRNRAEQGLDPLEETDNRDTIPSWDRSKQTEEYVLLLAHAKFLSTKIVITLDYGKVRKFGNDYRAKDSTGSVIKFNSIIDALNYMNSLGWEFVNAYTITVGNQNVYHYLMRRRLK